MATSVLAKFTELRNLIGGWELKFVKPHVMSLEKLNLKIENDLDSLIPPRGTIVIYYAAADSKVLDDLARAFLAENVHEVRSIARELQSNSSSRPRLSEEEALRGLHGADCLFDVRYRGKTIADLLGLYGGLRFATTTLSYIGGPTVRDDFQIVQYLKTKEHPGYKFLITIRPPVLTALEQAVIEKIPVEMLEVTVGRPMAADTAKEVADAVREAAEKAVRDKRARENGGPTPESTRLLHEIEEMLKAGTIGPTETAEALMRARHELLFRSIDR